jgi:hypothetical protein
MERVILCARMRIGIEQDQDSNTQRLGDANPSGRTDLCRFRSLTRRLDPQSHRRSSKSNGIVMPGSDGVSATLGLKQHHSWLTAHPLSDEFRAIRVERCHELLALLG